MSIFTWYYSSLMEGQDKAGWTPFFVVYNMTRRKIIQLLVASGCNTDAKDNLGKTAETYGDDVAAAYINQTKPASPRSPKINKYLPARGL